MLELPPLSPTWCWVPWGPLDVGYTGVSFCVSPHAPPPPASLWASQVDRLRKLSTVSYCSDILVAGDVHTFLFHEFTTGSSPSCFRRDKVKKKKTKPKPPKITGEEASGVKGGGPRPGPLTCTPRNVCVCMCGPTFISRTIYSSLLVSGSWELMSGFW